MARISVDFPQPDSPATPMISPRLQLKVDVVENARSALVGCAPSRAGRAPTERDRRSSRPPQPRIDQIAQPVTEKTEAEHDDKDREAREGRVPPAFRQVLAALGDGEAPVGIGRRRADAEEAEHRQRQDREPHAGRGANDDRRGDIGQDVQGQDAEPACAEALERVDEQGASAPAGSRSRRCG